MSTHDQDIRQRINAQAGRCHELARAILGIDWYDTESAARRVIEHFVEACDSPTREQVRRLVRQAILAECQGDSPQATFDRTVEAIVALLQRPAELALGVDATPYGAAVSVTTLDASGHALVLHSQFYPAGQGGAARIACPPASEPTAEPLREALAKCVASLDQLLPHLATIPADIGLLNDALVSARPLLTKEDGQ